MHFSLVTAIFDENIAFSLADLYVWGIYEMDMNQGCWNNVKQILFARIGLYLSLATAILAQFCRIFLKNEPI